MIIANIRTDTSLATVEPFRPFRFTPGSSHRREIRENLNTETYDRIGLHHLQTRNLHKDNENVVEEHTAWQQPQQRQELPAKASRQAMETVMEINELPKTVPDHVNICILLEQELYGLYAVEGRSNGGEDQSLLQHCRS
jgi:hypothetical protein